MRSAKAVPDSDSQSDSQWPADVYRVLKAANVQQMAYVPDAGHSALIRLFSSDPQVVSNVLTTEEEGIAIAVGAWLGGQRSVLLMQSSGVGNCINMLSLVKTVNFPFFALVTMRGEFGEFNPWQVPMGSATPGALELMGIQVLRATNPAEVYEVVHAGAAMAYGGHTPTAVLLSQRLIGAKVFAE